MGSLGKILKDHFCESTVCNNHKLFLTQLNTDIQFKTSQKHQKILKKEKNKNSKRIKQKNIF